MVLPLPFLYYSLILQNPFFKKNRVCLSTQNDLITYRKSFFKRAFTNSPQPIRSYDYG